MSSDRYNHDAVKQENEKHMYRVTYWDDIYGNWTDLPAKTPGWYPDMRYKCNGIVSELIVEPIGSIEDVRYYHASVISEYAENNDTVEYCSDITGNWTDTEGEPLWSSTTKYRCNGVESATAGIGLNSSEAKSMLYGITPDNPTFLENAAARKRLYEKAAAEPDVHPLINDASPHYQMVDGEESITIMEKMFTKEELMAWAKITSYKYRFRLGKKDDNSKDIKKMQTYESYYTYLKNKE